MYKRQIQYLFSKLLISSASYKTERKKQTHSFSSIQQDQSSCIEHSVTVLISLLSTVWLWYCHWHWLSDLQQQKYVPLLCVHFQHVQCWWCPRTLPDKQLADIPTEITLVIITWYKLLIFTAGVCVCVIVNKTNKTTKQKENKANSITISYYYYY